jgi:hypothetical protein
MPRLRSPRAAVHAALVAQALVGARIQPVASGDQQAEDEEGAGRQDGDQEAGIGLRQHLDGGQRREDHFDAGEDRSLADEFAHGAEQGDHPDEADAHHQPVVGRSAQAVLGGEGFDAGQHDAVGDDQRDENAEHQVEVVQEGVEGQIDHGDQRGDDQDEDGMRIS